MKEVTAKEGFAKFIPYSFVFVISTNKEGKPNGMVAAWNMKCSHDPPLLIVSLSKRGNTHKLVRESEEFVVAVPNKGLEEEVRFFGSHHGNEVDKFTETGIGTTPAKHIKSPLLTNATINFECKLVKEVDAGDHILFIGEILASYINEDKKVLFQVKRVGDERVFKEFP